MTITMPFPALTVMNPMGPKMNGCCGPVLTEQRLPRQVPVDIGIFVELAIRLTSIFRPLTILLLSDIVFYVHDDLLLAPLWVCELGNPMLSGGCSFARR
jgi:hypothetical protein